jgi:hypothetical protein
LGSVFFGNNFVSFSGVEATCRNEKSKAF